MNLNLRTSVNSFCVEGGDGKSCRGLGGGNGGKNGCGAVMAMSSKTSWVVKMFWSRARCDPSLVGLSWELLAGYKAVL